MQYNVVPAQLGTADLDAASSAAFVANDPPTASSMQAALDALVDVTTAQLDAASSAAFVANDPPTASSMQAALDALNDITAADVKTQVTTALSSYGVSTHLPADVAALVSTELSGYGVSTFTTQDYDNLTSQINYNAITKGSSFEFDIVMVQSTDHRSPSSGDTITGQYTLDGSTGWTAFTTDSAITEVGSGLYHVALSTAETNANFSGSYRFTASGADARIITLKITK
jgi:hypothetical protein